MSSKYRIPKNPDCPLTKKERDNLLEKLDAIEWEAYYPYKHDIGGFAEVKVWKYDEDTIWIEVKSGIEDSDHKVEYTDTVKLDRETLTIYEDEK